jgi:hypothetical protein
MRKIRLHGSVIFVGALAFLIVLPVSLASVSAPSLGDSPRPTKELDLPSILKKAAEYCDRLSRAVLNFVCREQVDEWFIPLDRLPGTVFLGVREVTSRYVYDYQLTRERAGLIRENRTLLEEAGKEVRVPDAPLKTHIFSHAYVVMGPLGLLSRSSQADNDYRVIREEKVNGEPAVVLEAVPKPGVQSDHLFGTIWLRKSDAGILKIQWNPSSIANYEGVEAIAKELGTKPGILMTSEYAFEKNGIRFPSRYSVDENYIWRPGRRMKRSQTVVTYDRYRFFTVETDVVY